MPRLDFLRDLDKPETPPSPPKAPAPDTGASERSREGKGLGRRLLAAFVILLLVGAGLFYLARPDLRRLTADLVDFDFGGKRAAAEAARADSLRKEAVRAQASRTVDEGLALSVAWLDQLETLPPEDGTWSATLWSFSPPGRFVLKGTARAEETVSAIQEALVLFPGADLAESRAEKTSGPRGPALYAFGFSGTVALAPEDTLPADRTISPDRLPAAFEALRGAAFQAGIALSEPVVGPVSAGGGLEARTWRLAGPCPRCDSAGISQIRAFLDAERRRGSPFGLRRLTLENREGHRVVFLDIMAFIR